MLNRSRVRELLLQSVEAELRGVRIYDAALACAIHPSLRAEWQECLVETRVRVATLQALCDELELDPDTETPGRAVVRHIGNALVAAMRMAQQAGDPAAAQLAACECVVLAETRDHADWELISQVARHGIGKTATAMHAACNSTEEEKALHLFHSRGWCRELWAESLGLPVVLPPPVGTRQNVRCMN